MCDSVQHKVGHTKPGVTKQLIDRDIVKKQSELRLITRSVTKNNSDLSHLRSKKLLYDLDQVYIIVKR